MNPAQTPSAQPHPRTRVILHELAGVALVLGGSLVLLGLVWISNDPSPFAEHLLFHLGLALTSLISAGAQVLVVVGVAVLRSAARRNRQAR